jgi:integrase
VAKSLLTPGNIAASRRAGLGVKVPRRSHEERSRLFTRGIRGYIHPLANGRYRARLAVPGVERWVTPSQLAGDGKGGSFATAAEAWSWCEAAHELIVARGRVEHGYLILPENAKEKADRKTIAEIAEARFWETGRKKKNSTKTTINQRSQFNAYVAPTLGRLYPDQLDEKAWEAWVGSLFTMQKKQGGGPLSDSLRNQVYHLGASIVRRLHHWGYIERSPISNGDSPVVVAQPKKPERILEPEEVIRLAEAATRFATPPARLPASASGRAEPSVGVMEGEANRLCVLLMGFSGPRIGETFGLRVDDVMRQTSEIVIDEQQQIVDGKAIAKGVDRVVYKAILKRSRSHRRVPVPPNIMDMLVDYIDRRIGWDDPRAVLFPSRATYWRDKVFHPAWKAAGLNPLLPHDLRHTTATQLYDHDYKIEEIAKVLGDTVSTVEATYVHIFALRGRGDRMKAYDERVAAALLDTNAMAAEPLTADRALCDGTDDSVNHRPEDRCEKAGDNAQRTAANQLKTPRTKS